MTFPGVREEFAFGDLDYPEMSPGRHAAVILAHGGGQDASAFRPEAEDLLRAGVAALRLDLPAAREMPAFDRGAEGVQAMARMVDRISEAVETLRKHSRVDASRIAYVGISYGAWLGIVAASRTAPLSRYVLIAPPPRMSEFLAGDSDLQRNLRSGAGDQAVAAYLRALSAFDAAAHISAIRDVPVLFQWGTHDQFIPRESAEELSSSAGPNATSRWYEVDHPGIMDDALARADRLEWLLSGLGERPAK